ncbi:hypothetical protein TNCV_1092691 [Trichonephila clavipes]|nr:hypothetical protein TNCV_1092691 [Trichonephila clavipes]
MIFQCYSLSTHVANTLFFRLYIPHFPNGLEEKIYKPPMHWRIKIYNQKIWLSLAFPCPSVSSLRAQWINQHCVDQYQFALQDLSGSLGICTKHPRYKPALVLLKTLCLR